HLARFLFRGDDVFKSVGVLSGGERSRLALARLAARHANLLVLDEPTTPLDLLAREQLESVLGDFDGALLFVSHDRYFIDKLATEIWPIEAGVLKKFEGNWTGLQRLRASGAELPLPMVETGGAAGDTAQGFSREPRVLRPGRTAANTTKRAGQGAASERAPKPGQGEWGGRVSAFGGGLTGQSGAGKSMVAGMLRELGAKVLDADALVRDEQVRGTVGYSAIVQTFGTKVLGEDKEIDRAKLAEE